MTRFPATQGTGGAVSGLPCAGPITTYFGVRDGLHPVGHAGVDIGSARGTAINAPASASVRKVWVNHPIYGNAVELHHGDDTSTIYMHMESVRVRERDWVIEGDTLGWVGATGFATGPHLHWGMAPAGKADFNYPPDTGPVGVLLNPLDYCGEEPMFVDLDPVIDVEEIALIQELLKKFVIGGAVELKKVRGSNPTEYRLVVH